MEDEQLKDLLRSLPDNPIAYGRVVEALFNASSSSSHAQVATSSAGTATSTNWGGGGSVSGFTDAGVESGGAAAAAGGGAAGGGGAVPLAELPGVPMSTSVDVVEVVVRVVREVATCHGAIPMTSTPLGVAHAAAPKDAVRLLSPSGTQVGGGLAGVCQHEGMGEWCGRGRGRAGRVGGGVVWEGGGVGQGRAGRVGGGVVWEGGGAGQGG